MHNKLRKREETVESSLNTNANIDLVRNMKEERQLPGMITESKQVPP
jgi:hypothetical protein